MSIFHTAELSCPNCGTENEVSWAASVNADRRADLRASILDGSFQSHDCTHCGTRLRLPAHLTYLDLGRRNWIVLEDAELIGDWKTLEAETRALFDTSFGAGAPAAARSLADGLQPRLVYGWPALREKLLVTEYGLDDVTLELVKLALLRGASGVPAGPSIALRLVAASDTSLTLDATNEQSEASLGTAEVPRSLYDDIAGDIDSWAALRADLSQSVFVDINRLLMPSTSDA